MSATIHTNDCVRQRARFGARSKAGDVCSCGGLSSTTTATPEPNGGFRMVQVRLVRDAIGAYCLDCQRGIGEPWQVFPWSWRKSQKLHENGTGHRTIMYKLV